MVFVKAWARYDYYMYGKKTQITTGRGRYKMVHGIPPISTDMIFNNDIPLGHILLEGERKRYAWLRDNFEYLVRNADGTCHHIKWPKDKMVLAELIDKIMTREKRIAKQEERKRAKQES